MKLRIISSTGRPAIKIGVHRFANNWTNHLPVLSSDWSSYFSSDAGKLHLHRIFKKTVGLTIHVYIQRRQLTEAAKFLIFSQKSIMEMALIGGDENQQAFTNPLERGGCHDGFCKRRYKVCHIC